MIIFLRVLRSCFLSFGAISLISLVDRDIRKNKLKRPYPCSFDMLCRGRVIKPTISVRAPSLVCDPQTDDDRPTFFHHLGDPSRGPELQV